MAAQEPLVEMLLPADLAVEWYSCGIDRPFVLIARRNGTRFIVIVLSPTPWDPPFDPRLKLLPHYPPTPEPLPGYDTSNSIESAHLRRLSECISINLKAQSEAERKISNQTVLSAVSTVRNLIITVAGPMMRKLAADRPAGPGETLSDILDPKTIYLQMVTLDNEVACIERDDFVPNLIDFLEPQDVTGVSDDLPVLKPSDLTILEQLERCLQRGRSYKVMVKEGRPSFCKVLVPGNEVLSISRECKMLQRVHDSCGLDPTGIRAPHLEGLVGLDGDRGRVVGFLTSYIEPHSRLGDLVASAERPRREKWADQIDRSIKLLHGHGLVWGNVSPSSVLVDGNDDTWIVDFSRKPAASYAMWEKTKTKEGDLEAFQVMRQQPCA